MRLDESLQTYQIYVSSLIAHESKRLQSNAMYGASSLGVVGFLPDIADVRLVYLVLAIIAILWFQKILYYRRLSKSKFYVIDMMEDNLSLQPFRQEWIHFKRTKWFSFELTWIELCVPLVQFLISVLLLYSNSEFSIFSM